MTSSLFTLAIGYVALALLLLLALLRSEIGAGRKLLLTLACAVLYLWHYLALQDYPGWPADAALPARFELIASRIDEPDRRQDKPGAIYLWLRDLDAEGEPPRAYRLDYHRALHRKIDTAENRQEQGERLLGSPVAGGDGAESDIRLDLQRRDRKANKAPGG